MALVWVALTFLAVVMLVGGVGLALAGRGQVDIASRLATVSPADRSKSPVEKFRLARDEAMSGLPRFNRMLQRWSWSKRLQTYLTQAGWHIRPGKLVLICCVTGMAAYVVASLLLPFALLALAVGILCGLFPLLLAIVRRRRRLYAFEKSFPEVIDLLVRAVRAGHAFTTGMEMIANEMPQPIAGEFRTTFEEHNFGLPLRDALWNLAERVPLVDVRFFVSALLIQKETGGNLAEILNNLAHVIRERFKIMGELRVRTAQGRLTAIILIGMPPGLLVFMKFANPDYVNLLFSDPWGTYMLVGAACLQIIGSLIMWRVVKIDV
jgi:tight adherence protein B